MVPGTGTPVDPSPTSLGPQLTPISTVGRWGQDEDSPGERKGCDQSGTRSSPWGVPSPPENGPPTRLEVGDWGLPDLVGCTCSVDTSSLDFFFVFFGSPSSSRGGHAEDGDRPEERGLSGLYH